MCRAEVDPEAQQALAGLLRDMAMALDPEHPEAVQVGPVDFGAESNIPTQRTEQSDTIEVRGPELARLVFGWDGPMWRRRWPTWGPWQQGEPPSGEGS